MTTTTAPNLEYFVKFLGTGNFVTARVVTDNQSYLVIIRRSFVVAVREDGTVVQGTAIQRRTDKDGDRMVITQHDGHKWVTSVITRVNVLEN